MLHTVDVLDCNVCDKKCVFGAPVSVCYQCGWIFLKLFLFILGENVFAVFIQSVDLNIFTCQESNVLLCSRDTCYIVSEPQDICPGRDQQAGLE